MSDIKWIRIFQLPSAFHLFEMPSNVNLISLNKVCGIIFCFQDLTNMFHNVLTYNEIHANDVEL